MDIQSIKQRFDIIGNTPAFNRAIEVAVQVAPTDLSVLVTGESGVGKEKFPQIIHSFSHRKHAQYVAVNCGAIPEGTIDSELFGHEKGAFTGAVDKRKGYFEVANGGTIFLDEVGELPLSTQVRLLRVLETGEFMKVGSSVVEKTNVRVVAATNLNVAEAVKNGKFREDLYYRLNTVPIIIPPLRERKEDVAILFRKFSADFAEKYRMPVLRLDDQAVVALQSYRWPGNIRQLKNITEQISIIEQNRQISIETLLKYLPQENSRLPAIFNEGTVDEKTFKSEREILYKILFDMKNDMSDLKRVVAQLMSGQPTSNADMRDHSSYKEVSYIDQKPISNQQNISYLSEDIDQFEDTEEFVEESLSLADKEKELIIKALNKHNGKRKLAAEDLGISERTLYRKIKEYELE
ncbi:MAG: sigma-54-dependent Fis family transcriptional regulator [Bacteroidales bacterium]|nr:sigma-54-dependent Fis family transcriptional regulator [Bacteroidales bacterium]